MEYCNGDNELSVSISDEDLFDCWATEATNLPTTTQTTPLVRSTNCEEEVELLSTSPLFTRPTSSGSLMSYRQMATFAAPLRSTDLSCIAYTQFAILR